jgi:hypothetical protein
MRNEAGESLSPFDGNTVRTNVHSPISGIPVFVRARSMQPTLPRMYDGLVREHSEAEERESDWQEGRIGGGGESGIGRGGAVMLGAVGLSSRQFSAKRSKSTH